MQNTSAPCPRGVPTKSQKVSLESQNPLAEWLESLHWDSFITITPRNPRHDSIAFLRDIKNELFSDWKTYGVKRAFLAAEPFRYQRNLHVHGLLEGEYTPHGRRVYSLELPWEVEPQLRERFGFSRVEAIRSHSQVSLYCAKYVTKWGDGDNYDFIGDWTS